MFKFKTLSSILLIFMFTIGTALAQLSPAEKPSVNVSDHVLEKVASAILNIQSLEQQTQQEMMQAVLDEGLTVDRFTEMQQAQFNPDQESDASDEETKMYNEAMKKLEQIQFKAQESMKNAIQDEGLTVEQYQDILNVVQQDPELQQKIQQYLQGNDE